jgi:uncharacterized membrane protein (DUF106 family)
MLEQQKLSYLNNQQMLDNHNTIRMVWTAVLGILIFALLFAIIFSFGSLLNMSQKLMFESSSSDINNKHVESVVNKSELQESEHNISITFK